MKSTILKHSNIELKILNGQEVQAPLEPLNSKEVKTPKKFVQMVIDISLEEQELLNKASSLIAQAMQLNGSSSVRKFEYIFNNLDAPKRIQVLQAAGNVMFLDCWDNILIESHKSAWSMLYKFKYPPT